MVTARLRGKEAMLEIAVEGLEEATRVTRKELLLRAAIALGVQARAEVGPRCEARWLKDKETLAEAGVAPGDLVDVYAGEGSGMPGSPGLFASPDARVAGEDGLAETVRSLLAQVSGDEPEIADALQRLRTLQPEPVALKQEPRLAAGRRCFLGVCMRGSERRAAVREAPTEAAAEKGQRCGTDTQARREEGCNQQMATSHRPSE
jgi:hypothetical protein